jgi:hypothetical protein
MKRYKNWWLTFALLNLCIVATLGVLLRTKMVFPLEAVEFTNVLEAHYHFAMNGWITFTLMVLLVSELLPEGISDKPVYQWLRFGMLFTSYSLALSFIIYGYHFLTITIITLYILIAFVFAFVFGRDIIKAMVPVPLKILSVCAMISLVLSCIGPETFLGYVLASHSMNVLIFRDTAYTYLHFQYNAFFPLSIFAIFFKYLYTLELNAKALRLIHKVSVWLPVTIIPTLFLSYLWHYPNIYVRSVSAVGCVCLYIFLFQLYRLLFATWGQLKRMPRYAKFLGILSLISLSVKILLQTGTVFSYVGIIVFGNRPIIIGYIHLVMLGFISLFILSHFVRVGLLNCNFRVTRTAIVVFASGVVVNEFLLMLQGLSQIFMKFYPIYLWLLWMTMIWLLAGALLLLFSRVRYRNFVSVP